MSFFRTIADFINAVSPLGSVFDLGHEPPEIISTDTRLTPNISGRRMNRKGYPVIRVKADNYMDVARMVDNQTVAGDASVSIVHAGGRQWEIRVEEWDTEFKKG